MDGSTPTPELPTDPALAALSRDDGDVSAETFDTDDVMRYWNGTAWQEYDAGE